MFPLIIPTNSSRNIFQVVALQTSLVEMVLFVAEIVSFLYAILMNAGNAQSSNPTLPEATINLITEALSMLNFMGTVDLKVLQVSNGTVNSKREDRRSCILNWSSCEKKSRKPIKG